MKTTLSLIVVLAWGALSASGQDYIVKQRAKEVRDQNNVRQGVPPPQTPPPSGAPAAPGAPRPAGGLSPAAQQNIATIQSDLAALNAKSPEQKPQLYSHLLAAALGTAKPSQESVTKLVLDLQTAMAGKELTPDSQNRLARNLNAAVNCANLSRDQTQTIANDVQAILQAGGAKRGDAVTVGEDIKAVVADVKKAAGK